jgi:hypothetical protein
LSPYFSLSPSHCFHCLYFPVSPSLSLSHCFYFSVSTSLSQYHCLCISLYIWVCPCNCTWLCVAPADNDSGPPPQLWSPAACTHSLPTKPWLTGYPQVGQGRMGRGGGGGRGEGGGEVHNLSTKGGWLPWGYSSTGIHKIAKWRWLGRVGQDTREEWGWHLYRSN